MSFPQYPEYKDTEVQWIGDIPAHWEFAPLKWHLIANEGGVWGSDPNGVNDTPVLRSTDQSVDGRWRVSTPALRLLGLKEKASALLRAGDLVVTKSSGSSLHIGKTTLVTDGMEKGRYCYGNFMQRLRVKGSLLPKICWYLMNNQLCREQLNLLSNSTTGLANLNGTLLGELFIPIPPLQEQTQIARFLDHETAKIDALIREQERLIGLLQEKRQAVISHAVTKGLDSGVPMRDSRVEWLGDMPGHWIVARLKHVVRTKGGSTPSKENLGYWDGDIPWVSPKDMKKRRISDSADHISQAALEDTGLSLIETGSVLIVVRGMILAHSVPVAITETPVTINQDMKALEPGIELNSEYLLLLLSGIKDAIFEYIDSSAHGTKKLEWERFEAIQLPVPSLKEQGLLVSEVEKLVADIDRLSDEAKSLTRLLQERRSALISAAVTGKIDVRGWQLPADESAFDEELRQTGMETTA